MSDGTALHWCPACYAAGIEKLVMGFTHTYSMPPFSREYPPLEPRMAIGVRRTAAEILASRPIGSYPGGHTHGIGS